MQEYVLQCRAYLSSAISYADFGHLRQAWARIYLHQTISLLLSIFGVTLSRLPILFTDVPV